MEANKVLTDFSRGSLLRPELANLLAEAGLELWQAPEGFWAIRLKPTAVRRPAKPTRRRPR